MEHSKCKKCGKTDSIIKTLVCRDCDSPANLNDYGQPLANLCRDCCPTGHGTRKEDSYEKISEEA